MKRSMQSLFKALGWKRNKTTFGTSPFRTKTYITIRKPMKTKIFAALLLLFTLPGFATRDSLPLNIVFIGNSITHGAMLHNAGQDAPPVKCAAWLESQEGIGKVEIENQGYNGASTFDFLPETGNLFDRVQAAADRLARKKGMLIFSLMLGTNDSAEEGTTGAPVSAEQYRKNVEQIVLRLLERYPSARIVLHRPLWYSPNTYNGAKYLVAGQKRLLSYTPQIEAVVASFAITHPDRVFIGDTSAYDDLKEHALTDYAAEEGKAGVFYLHPNERGGSKLARYWGEAILKAIQQ